MNISSFKSYIRVRLFQKKTLNAMLLGVFFFVKSRNAFLLEVNNYREFTLKEERFVKNFFTKFIIWKKKTYDQNLN